MYKSTYSNRRGYKKLNIKKPMILRKELPIEELNEKLKKSPELYFIGFDKRQVPRYSISYKLVQ